MKKVILSLALLILTPLAVVAARPSVYTVRAGDTLQSIARKTGLSLSRLVSYNPQLIQPGDVLNLTKTPAPVAETKQTAQTTQTTTQPQPATQIETPTQTQIQAPANSGNSLVAVAGWRSSDYGVETPTAVRQSDAAYYTGAAKEMSALFPGSRPGGIYTVGYIETNTTMLPNELGPSASGIPYVHIDDKGTQASPEAMLTAFDRAGMKIILSVEPGKADVAQLAKAILNRYKNHPSVDGFAVDNEWYLSEGGKMSAATANALRNAVSAVNPEYKTVLKHYDSANLPHGVTGIVYLTDSCGFRSETEAINDYAGWAKTFAGSELGFQFGYDTAECGAKDGIWWKPLGTGGEPALKLIEAIKAKVPSADIYSAYWVDFTILEQFPK